MDDITNNAHNRKREGIHNPYKKPAILRLPQIAVRPSEGSPFIIITTSVWPRVANKGVDGCTPASVVSTQEPSRLFEEAVSFLNYMIIQLLW